MSSAEDLVVFTNAVFGTDFLLTASHKLASTAVHLSNGDDARFSDAGNNTYSAFGWAIKRGETGEIVYWGHDGEINSSYAQVCCYPASKMAIAAISNYSVVAKNPAFFDKISVELPAILSRP